MPLSNPYLLPFIVDVASRVRPRRRLLDIGIGTGMVGLAVRQYLDIADGNLERGEWKITLDGIEIYEPYANPVWDFAYSRVLRADARQALPELGDYDLILLCDVIEHFDKSEGRAILDLCRRKARYVIVTSPNGEYEQGAAFGNEHETHRSAWRPEDFQRMPAFSRIIGNTFISVIAADRRALRALKLRSLPSLHDSAWAKASVLYSRARRELRKLGIGG